MSHLNLESLVRINVTATKQGRVALRLPGGCVLNFGPDDADRFAGRLAKEAAKARGKAEGGAAPAERVVTEGGAA